MISEIKTVDLASVFFINENIKQSYKPNCKLSDDELRVFLNVAKQITEYNYNILINKTEFLTKL